MVSELYDICTCLLKLLIVLQNGPETGWCWYSCEELKTYPLPNKESKGKKEGVFSV